MIQAICWVLIHSLWQGLIFTVATGLVMLYTKQKTAALRYHLLSGLFFLFLVVGGLTFVYEYHSGQTAGEGILSAMIAPEGDINSFVQVMGGYFSRHASLIVLGWFMVFLYRCVRMMGSLVYTQRIRSYRTSEAPACWQDKLQDFCSRLSIGTPVRLLESALVKMPLAAGHLKPVILVPLGMIARLPAGEIEAMLLHELAHIKRHDYLVNFLQHIAENIFFFNPALLWMSSLLRAEREHCCDDIAIEGTQGNKVQFIQALIHFKEYDLHGAGLACAFPAKKNQLVQRVMRIAHSRNHTMNAAEKIFFLGSVLGIALLLIFSGRNATGQVTLHRQQLVKDNLVAVSWLEQPDAGRLEDLLKEDRPQTAGDAREEAGRARQVAGKREKGQKDREQADRDQARAENDRPDREQIEKERAEKEQAEKEHDRAVTDRQQAEKDRAQADLDKIQAERDRAQADRDRAQAEQDRKQAERDRQQARIDRVQADRDRVQADKDRAQADRIRTKTD